jgi:hypothetical protein
MRNEAVVSFQIGAAPWRGLAQSRFLARRIGLQSKPSMQRCFLLFSLWIAKL